MNKNAKAWIKALRSGYYRQGKFKLETSDGRFCCLGVACKLAYDAGVIEDGDQVYDGYRLAMPPSVQKWLGLKSCDTALNHVAVDDASLHTQPKSGWDGTVLFEDVGTRLSRLNDSGASFTKIADIIEANEAVLFKKAKDDAKG